MKNCNEDGYEFYDGEEIGALTLLNNKYAIIELSLNIDNNDLPTNEKCLICWQCAIGRHFHQTAKGGE